MDMLQVGNDVVIKVRHVLWDVRHRYAAGVVGPEFEYYSGTVTQQKYTNPDEIAITTNDPRIPFRRINRSRIVEVDGVKLDYVPPSPNKIVKTVKGSKGNTYTVTVENGKATCSCPGYSYRKSCRHIDEVM